MEQTDEGLTSNLKYENENSELDIEGAVIKVESKLTQIQKPNRRHENREQHIENQYQDEQSQNALSIEETIDIKLENEEITSYIYGDLKNSSAQKRKSTNNDKVDNQNICEIKLNFKV